MRDQKMRGHRSFERALECGAKKCKRRLRFFEDGACTCRKIFAREQQPCAPKSFQLLIALMRADKREILRDTVFLCTTPTFAVRIKIGWAALSAAAAAALSPAAMASSTFVTLVRIRLMRVRFTSVRRSVWRAAFFAEDVFAMVFGSFGSSVSVRTFQFGRAAKAPR
jgi:hypothetical protein